MAHISFSTANESFPASDYLAVTNNKIHLIESAENVTRDKRLEISLENLNSHLDETRNYFFIVSASTPSEHQK